MHAALHRRRLGQARALGDWKARRRRFCRTGDPPQPALIETYRSQVSSGLAPPRSMMSWAKSASHRAGRLPHLVHGGSTIAHAED